jgi:hypothetical protein
MKMFKTILTLLLIMCLIGGAIGAKPDTKVNNSTGNNSKAMKVAIDGPASEDRAKFAGHIPTPKKTGATSKYVAPVTQSKMMALSVDGAVAAPMAVSFTPTATTGNFINTTKKVCVYMPAMTNQVYSESSGKYITTTVTFDPYCTAMFYEYNPTYVNDSNIASRVTKANCDVLIVPLMEMSNSAANTINTYIASGGSVWFLNDPSMSLTGVETPNRITILNETQYSDYNSITGSSVITVDNTDEITNELPSSFSPVGSTEKWSFFRAFALNSGKAANMNYQVLMNNGDCDMLIKFENTTTGARVIYSNPNMFISGGDCSYFDMKTATNLFMKTKSWVMKLASNNYSASITYPTSDKQLTITLDDAEAADWEAAATQAFFDAEAVSGVSPAKVNTIFVLPDSYTTKAGLNYYANYSDTHTLHPHDYIWDTNATVAKYNANITAAKAMMNKAAGVTNYGFSSWRFPMTTYCTNAQMAVSNAGVLIDSTNGRCTDGVYIGMPTDNNLLFPKQVFVNGAKTNTTEIELTSSFDINALNQYDYYDIYVAEMPYLYDGNFPMNFVVGGHYQSVMTDIDYREALCWILEASQITNTAYATFDKIAKYTDGVKSAKITGSMNGNVMTVVAIPTKQIEDFTVKVANANGITSATCDGVAIPTSEIRQDGNNFYVSKTIGAGTHTFIINVN